MLMRPRPGPFFRRAAGFTLIELMTTIAVAAVLIGIAAPQMSLFVQNARIRATSESLQRGLSLARAEAIRQNRNIEFVRSDSGWVVRLPGSDTSLHEASGSEGTSGLTVTVAPGGADRITFDSLGRRTANANSSSPLQEIDVEAQNPPSSDNYRPLRVQIQATGASRLCWPDAESTDSRACL